MTALQRAEQLAQRKHIFEMKGGRKAVTLGGEQEIGFAKDASDKVGLSKTQINDDIKMAEGIPEKLRDELRGTESEDSLEDLKALAKEKDNPAAQKKAVKAVKSGEAANLRTALKAEPKSPTKTATNMAMDELTECLREHPDQDELRACLAFFKKSSPTICYDASMSVRRNLAIIATAVALSACASPDIDTSVPTFDETQYTTDLGDCRDGTVLEVTLSGLGGAVVGSAIGAFEGAIHGAWSGNSPEGAAIGAVVGGVFGVVVGAQEPIQEQEAALRRCLSEKGYVLAS